MATVCISSQNDAIEATTFTLNKTGVTQVLLDGAGHAVFQALRNKWIGLVTGQGQLEAIPSDWTVAFDDLPPGIAIPLFPWHPKASTVAEVLGYSKGFASYLNTVPLTCPTCCLQLQRTEPHSAGERILEKASDKHVIVSLAIPSGSLALPAEVVGLVVNGAEVDLLEDPEAFDRHRPEGNLLGVLLKARCSPENLPLFTEICSPVLVNKATVVILEVQAALRPILYLSRGRTCPACGYVADDVTPAMLSTLLSSSGQAEGTALHVVLEKPINHLVQQLPRCNEEIHRLFLRLVTLGLGHLSLFSRVASLTTSEFARLRLARINPGVAPILAIELPSYGLEENDGPFIQSWAALLAAEDRGILLFDTPTRTPLSQTSLLSSPLVTHPETRVFDCASPTVDAYQLTSPLLTILPIFKDIRELFARLPSSQIQCLTASSFLLSGRHSKRCSQCDGRGELLEQDLTSIPLPCPRCHGTRYESPITTVRFRGTPFTNLFAMTIGELGDMMTSIPSIRRFTDLSSKLTRSNLRLDTPLGTLSYRERLLVMLTTILYQALRSQAQRILIRGLDWGLTDQDHTRIADILRTLNQSSHREILIAH